MKARTNVYRHGTVWCHATWIDGEFDASDPLDIPDSVGTIDAIAAAAAMYADAHFTDHTITPVHNIPE